MLCDSHVHILPGMDTGRGTAEVTREMAFFMREQGIEAALLCPEYDPNAMTMARYLTVRNAAYERLMSTIDKRDRKHRALLVPAAEVPITEVTVHDPLLSKLTIPDTHILPCTLPENGISKKTMENLTYMMQKRRIFPCFLHFERYIYHYSNASIHRLLNLHRIMISVSIYHLKNKMVRDAAAYMLRHGCTILPCTQAKNMFSTPPMYDFKYTQMISPRDKMLYNRLWRTSDLFFRPLINHWNEKRIY